VLEQRKLDIFDDADPLQQRRALEDDPDAQSEAAQRSVVGLGWIEVRSIDGDRSARGALEPDEVAHEHRLSRLNRTEHEQRLVTRDVELDVEYEWCVRRAREVVNLERPLRGRGWE
jgi:hypothetical protein